MAVALLGPDGAGKTTTIEILEGFRMRSAGRAEVLGTDPAHGSEQWRARVGIVLQSWRDHGRWRVTGTRPGARASLCPGLSAGRSPGETGTERRARANGLSGGAELALRKIMTGG